MNNQPPPKPNRDTTYLMRYVGWGTQLFVILALAVYAGNKIDKRVGFKTSLFIWILPFVVLVLMMYKLIKETSKRKIDNDQKRI